MRAQQHDEGLVRKNLAAKILVAQGMAWRSTSPARLALLAARQELTGLRYFGKAWFLWSRNSTSRRVCAIAKPVAESA